MAHQQQRVNGGFDKLLAAGKIRPEMRLERGPQKLDGGGVLIDTLQKMVLSFYF